MTKSTSTNQTSILNYTPVPMPNRETVTVPCQWCDENYTENYQYYLQNKTRPGKFFCCLSHEHLWKDRAEDKARDWPYAKQTEEEM